MGDSQAGLIRQSDRVPMQEWKQDFIRRHWDEFPIDEYRSRPLIEKARTEGGYSAKSQDLTIFMGLNNEYARMKARLP
jgi:hypothetical protein